MGLNAARWLPRSLTPTCPSMLEHFEMCGGSFQSEKSLKAPGGINCRVGGIDQPPFQPSADTLWQ